MRFKKGSKVEVFSRMEGPSLQWRCGKIVFSGNGNTCSVRYDCRDDIVERVSRKVVRPCPPPLHNASNGWNAEDVVEVFDDLYWKTAAILKVIDQNQYLVRLIGSSKELQLHKIDIRLRQLWQEGKWVVIGKGSGSQEDMKSNKLSTFSCNQAETRTEVQAEENCFIVENNTGLQESFTVTAKTLNRLSTFRL